MAEAKARILVVDDEPTLLHGIAHLLRSAGYEVLEAGSGAEGLYLAQQTRPDLVLLDRMLPDLDGLDVCRLIKQDPALKRTFVVYISALRTSSDHQADGLDAGADGYIAKPISNRELLARVEAMLRIKRAEDERERLVAELQDALAQIKTLSGLLPICAGCKKIRDDKGYWRQLESYISEHTNAVFSHGLCPDCVQKYFPGFGPEEDEEK